LRRLSCVIVGLVLAALAASGAGSVAARTPQVLYPCPHVHARESGRSFTAKRIVTSEAKCAYVRRIVRRCVSGSRPPGWKLLVHGDYQPFRLRNGSSKIAFLVQPNGWSPCRAGS